MSYVNLSPETAWIKLERVLRNQRRLLVFNVAVTTAFAAGVLASIATLI
jgi:hypothetical protein